MSKDWIIDVLTDLRDFARANNLPSLAEQLEDTALVAASEIALTEGTSLAAGLKRDAKVERLPGRTADHPNAG